ncbi:FACT complex subunit pob3 [Zancudomyces culisetae]|uniref:FACT complex subunit POB3 n=1 Tax=Zancudomyces culisetae TaxID=1213189 RepID=A0A1R1PYP2_ZANCU|nr:FACT complex subunit pob3 [Zancudomyces culisetae]|eukprot:OMH86073.1 FACT complex subunit pob3 [Zancudomyces culisetae]
MAELRTSFPNIYLASKSYINARGEVRLGQSGIGWKPATDQDIQTVKASKINGISAETGLLVIQSAEIQQIIWQRVGRMYGIRIVLKNGTNHRLDGFDRDVYDDLKEAIGKYFHGITLENRELNVKGYNWGKAEFEGTNLVFRTENKPTFDLPLETVANTNLVGKSEVSIELQSAPEIAGKKRKNQFDELVEIRFYVPGVVAKDMTNKDSGGSDQEQEQSETSAAQVFYETVKSKADLGQISGKSIVNFSEVLCLTPRGRYNIDMYPKFLRLRGKTYDYKIMYEHVLKLFLVTKPDEMHVLFVINLSPPIRQGQTRYPFLVFQFLRDEEKEVVLNLDSETIKDKYDNQIMKRYEEPLYKTISELFKVFVAKKPIVPDTYRTIHGAQGAKCSLKANEGILYPLNRGILFVPKPAQFVAYSEINSVVFSRVGSGSASSGRTFDIVINSHTGTDIQFSSFNREEFDGLFNYLKEKNVKVLSDISEKATVSYAETDQSSDGEGSARGAQDSDEDESSVDEDFVAGSESDVPEEYNEDYSSENDE